MYKRLICALLSAFIFIVSVPAAEIDVHADSSSFEECMLEGAENFQEKVDISRFVNEGGWSNDDIKKKITDYFITTPEFFYVDNTFNIYYGGGKYYVGLNYLYSASKVKTMQKEMEKAALKAIAAIDDDMTDEQKALVVHDYLILNCKYDYSYTGYSAYDCLVKGKAVCQGYSLAYIYILENYLGIKCTTAVSDSQNHAWNYVNIGNKWYHVDLTADDATYSVYNGKSYDVFGTVMHENFLLSDSAVKESSPLHRNWRIVGNYPAASDTRYDNYFWKDVTSQIIEYKGRWYFCKNAKKTSGKVYSGLYSYNPSNGKTSLVKSFETKWYISRDKKTGKAVKYGSKWYTDSFAKLVLIDGKFYISTAKNIFRYNPTDGKMKKVYTLNKGENQQIYSIMQSGTNKIKVCYKPDISYSDNYLTIKLK